MLTQEQEDKTIQWWNSLNGHFAQTYIMLITPRGLIELDPPNRSAMPNRGGTGKITNEDGFVSWLYHAYAKEIEENARPGKETL